MSQPTELGIIKMEVVLQYTDGTSKNLEKTGLIFQTTNNISGALDNIEVDVTFIGSSNIGSFSTVTGKMEVLFDGVTKDAVIFGTSQPLASFSISATTLRQWDNQQHTTHDLTFRISKPVSVTATLKDGTTKTGFLKDSIEATVTVTVDATGVTSGSGQPPEDGQITPPGQTSSRTELAGKGLGWKHQGGMSQLSVMNYYVPTITEKLFLIEFWKPCDIAYVCFRRNEIGDVTDPNDPVIKHMLEWAEATKQKGMTVFFADWQSGMTIPYEDEAWIDAWADFWKKFTVHFKGKTHVVMGSPCEDVVYPGEAWPYPTTGSEWFNTLWKEIMTKIAKAVHSVDPAIPFCMDVTGDWGGGCYTLGSQAYYPNAFQPLDEPNVIYRTMWNPPNQIKTSSLYPFDDSGSFPDDYGSGMLRGLVNFHQETGLPVTMELLVEYRDGFDVFEWDSAGLQWVKDIVSAFKGYGVGITNFGTYACSDTVVYCSHKGGLPITLDPETPEWPWVEIYKESI